MSVTNNPNDANTLTQGKNYAGDDFDIFENQGDDDGQPANGQPMQEEEWEGPPNQRPPKKPLNKNIFIFGGIGLLLFAVILFSVAYMANKNKQEKFEEWEAQNAEVFVFEYTPEEREALRANGYTGGEIEDNQQAEVAADILIERAAKARQDVWDKEWKPLQDRMSPEYKELAENTWVGGKELDYGTDESLYTYHIFTYNGTYKKIPARGNQLFIRVTLKDGSSVFMSVTPQRYTTLDDSGNIVIDITYTDTKNGLVITDVKERIIS